MPATVGDLRAFGTRPVSIRTRDGVFAGTIVQAALGDAAIVVMLAPAVGTSEPLVIAIDAIDEIVER